MPVPVGCVTAILPGLCTTRALSPNSNRASLTCTEVWRRISFARCILKSNACARPRTGWKLFHWTKLLPPRLKWIAVAVDLWRKACFVRGTARSFFANTAMPWAIATARWPTTLPSSARRDASRAASSGNGWTMASFVKTQKDVHTSPTAGISVTPRTTQISFATVWFHRIASRTLPCGSTASSPNPFTPRCAIPRRWKSTTARISAIPPGSLWSGLF